MKKIVTLVKKWSGYDFLCSHIRVLQYIAIAFFVPLFAFLVYENINEGEMRVVVHCGDFEAVGGMEFDDFESCSDVSPHGCMCSRVDGPYLVFGKMASWYFGDP